jgi:hypothetical protein
MKFARNLSAVVVTVAVIIGLGLLWAHEYGGSSTSTRPGTGPGTGGGAGNGGLPPRVAAMRLAHGKAAGLIQAHSSSGGFQIADASNLVRTILIEAALAAVVIAASVAWRRHRRLQRMAASM